MTTACGKTSLRIFFWFVLPIQIKCIVSKRCTNLLYIYLGNIWSSHVRQKFLEIPTVIGEKKKEKLATTAIMKKLD
jgi:hypothetical protein